jgi:hypothetical protein
MQTTKPKEQEQGTKRCDICGGRDYLYSAYYRHIKTNKHTRNEKKKINSCNMLKDINIITSKTHILFLEKLRNDINYFLDNNI